MEERAKSPPPSACLPDEELTELVGGIAAPEERARLESHVASCPSCTHLVAEVRATRTEAPGFLAIDTLLGGASRAERTSGRYEILERIGAGGMGTVYAAHDPALDRRVALKVIRAQVAGPDLEARLLREAKAMARLSHPEVIAVHDAGRDGDRLFIAMELIEGGTLREWLERAPRSWREIVGVYVRAGRGLAQAHASGLVHRDFKPDNVLIGTDGRVRVTDFGLARELEQADDPQDVAGASAASALAASPVTGPRLTRTGALLGTPVYMAPEQLAGKSADARSDGYSFCVALYEALYGVRPFTATTVLAQRLEKEEEVIGSPSPGSRVPPRVRRVLLSGLRASPEERFPSMQALLDALERAARWPFVLPRRPLASIAALVAVCVLGGLALWQGARWRSAHTAPAAPGSIATAVAALAGPDARLACPIFETEGVSDVAVRLGAAAATLVCLRERWELGGRDDRVLPPAALLGVPTHPVDDYPDPYVAPEQRARTIAAAKGHAAAYIDGKVTSIREAWTIDLTLRAPDDEVIARARGNDVSFLLAVHQAAEALWAKPLTRRAIDPEVARWTSFPDAEAGAVATNLLLFAWTKPCIGLDARAAAYGRAFPFERRLCEVFDGLAAPENAPPPALDSSSPEALVASLRTFRLSDAELPIDEARRLVAGLERRAAEEHSVVGQAQLALTTGLLWSEANDRERAEGPLLRAVRLDPLLFDGWEVLARPEGVSPVLGAASVASAWFPAEATFLVRANSWRADELGARLRETRLAFVLDPRAPQARFLARALIDAGRAEEAHALAATSLDDPEASRLLHASVLAMTELHDAKLGRAISHLEEEGDVGIVDLAVAADVAGRSGDVATRFAERFLASADAQAGNTARGYHTPMILCMRAEKGLAQRCLDRIDALGHAAHNWWYEGGSALLAGARRYAGGDVRGAVSFWRPLVAGSNMEIVRTLPTEAFEAAGERDLAARLDARKMAFTIVAGISDAAPREAKRAFARGDRQKAIELARRVVQAWEVADVEIPAVAAMRALLATTAEETTAGEAKAHRTAVP